MRELPPTAGRLGEDANAEEHREAERHNELYRTRRRQQLLMQREDWEKFDRIAVPLNAYHAAVKRLGDLQGVRVLDAGCGDGWLSVILAKRGAHVTGFDISREAIRTAFERAAVNHVETEAGFAVASSYVLPFASAAFDAVIGQAILHHLGDKRRAAKELFRVLRPGGRAVFAEPLGDSLVLERLRLLVPVRSEAKDDPDQWAAQFKHSEIEPFRGLFDVDFEEYQLLSRLDRVLKGPRVREWLGRIDRALLRAARPLRRYARTIVLEFRRPAAPLA